MKLILLAQTAFGLNLKEVFNRNFENTDIATHGCHCARISGHSKTAANSDQTSDLDTQCHNWQRARNCAKQSHQCHAFDNDYDSSVECEDQVNPCRILTCRLDKEFVTRINSAKAGIDFSASAQCSFDFQAPQTHENRACCLSNNFESEFYNYNEKTCNNGVVSTEPVEFTENHLTQLVAHLRTIPNLPFNVTDEWRGPGIGNLNDLNGALLDDLDSAPEPVQTNVRKKRQNLPSRFDLRDDVRCGMIARGVDNTGACASCYAQAVSTVASISMCIASNGASQHRLSAMDIMNCGAYQSSKPCQGGNIVAAAYHFKNNGLVTGSSLLERLGEIEYDVGCFPYRAGPGSSHNDESYLWYIPPYDNPPRGYTIDMSRNCPTECYADYPKIMEHKPFVNDKKGNDPNLQLVNYAGNVLSAMQHIRDHGPLIAVMAVYDDFLTYGGGIYEPHSINFQGSYRTVALIGWGSENGKDYWIVKDAKGKDWGENGFFKIIRGVNAVGIESFLMFGYKWNCASGQVVDENGKCKTAECAGNQYREGNDCINCPMNAQANSDNTGCQIKSEYSQTQRWVLWRNYGFETARPITIDSRGINNGPLINGQRFGGSYVTDGTVCGVEVLPEIGDSIVFAHAPQVIDGSNPVYLIYTDDNVASFINDESCYPPSPINEGPVIDVSVTNYIGADVVLYWIDFKGDPHRETTLQGTVSSGRSYNDYYWSTTIGKRLAIKTKGTADDEWIWVGEISHRDWLVWNGEVEIAIDIDPVTHVKVVKRKF